MVESKSSPGPVFPLGIKWALGLATLFFLFVTWDQSYWWMAKEDYSFGWLVPACVAYVIHDRWPQITALLAKKPTDEHRRSSLDSSVSTIFTYAVFIGGILLFCLGAIFRTAAGPSYQQTLALTLGSIGTCFALLYLSYPSKGRPAYPSERRGLIGLFIFPICVWLISAPMLAVVESNLNLFLMNQVTSVVFFVFELLGFPLEQRGNVLVLPGGSVGVAEACSGIRSLTGCLFAGSFLAAVFIPTRWGKLFLVAIALGFAVVMNLLRSIFLTSWAYAYGAKAIEGTVHDVSGYAVLGMTIVGLMCIMPWLNRTATPLTQDRARTTQ